MSVKETTVELPVLTRAASFTPDSVNDEQRTADVVWTTGARVLRGYYDQYFEELSLDPKHVRMERLNGGGAPLLNAHSSYDLGNVIGVVQSASLEKTRGLATVRFARAEDDPEADAIFRKVKDGIIRNVSVGYRIHKMEKTESGDGTIPVYRAVDWEPFEISPVPIGADAGAGFRAADAGHKNKCVFVTRQEEPKMATTDPGATTTTTTTPGAGESAAVAATRAASTARIEDAKARAELTQAAKEEAITAERVRSSEIRKIAKRAAFGDDWAGAVIEAGTTVDEARKVAFDAMAARDSKFSPEDGGHTRIGAGDDEREKFIRGASAWLFLRTGTKAMLERAKEIEPEMFKTISFEPGEFRGYTPRELARLCLERARVDTRGMDSMTMVGKAFTHRTSLQTTGDFPILLENVVGKILLGAYLTQVNTWSRFCKQEDVPDFRISNRYRTGSLPNLDIIAEHGEYKTGIIPDGAKYGITTQRYGKMFGITEETIVNDDMGALVDQATKLGQAAMRTIETGVYALLAQNAGLGPTQGDGQAFFHANRSNVNATGSGLSVAGIDADRVILRKQKDPSGLDFLDLSPRVLLVADELYGQALEINKAEFDFDNAGTNTTGKFQRPNRVRGLFQDVVSSPRLSGTRRYLFTDTMEAIIVAFLEGKGRGPVIQSQQGWRVDGTEWKVSLYAKPQMGDAKAAVTNAGV